MAPLLSVATAEAPVALGLGVVAATLALAVMLMLVVVDTSGAGVAQPLRHSQPAAGFVEQSCGRESVRMDTSATCEHQIQGSFRRHPIAIC